MSARDDYPYLAEFAADDVPDCVNALDEIDRLRLSNDQLRALMVPLRAAIIYLGAADFEAKHPELFARLAEL